MNYDKVLRLLITHLGSGDTQGFYYYLQFIPSIPANAIERKFYERLKIDGNIKAACRAAKRVAKNFLGHI